MKRAIALALVLASASEASAYVRSESPGGQCLFWNRREIPWVLNEKGSADVLPIEELVAALQRSFQTWEDVECSDITFRYDGLTSGIDAGREITSTSGNENSLIWRELSCNDAAPPNDDCFIEGTCPELYDCWDHAAGIIALTTTSFSNSTGVIVDADIEFNGVDFDFTVGDGPPCAAGVTAACVSTDVQNTATHEIGHMLGFDHSPVLDSTMAATAALGETSKRTLEQDDIDALCDVYPAGGRVLTCSPSGNVRISPDPDDGGCHTMPVAGVAGLLALLVRRRRVPGERGRLTHRKARH